MRGRIRAFAAIYLAVIEYGAYDASAYYVACARRHGTLSVARPNRIARMGNRPPAYADVGISEGSGCDGLVSRIHFNSAPSFTIISVATPVSPRGWPEGADEVPAVIRAIEAASSACEKNHRANIGYGRTDY